MEALRIIGIVFSSIVAALAAAVTVIAAGLYVTYKIDQMLEQRRFIRDADTVVVLELLDPEIVQNGFGDLDWTGYMTPTATAFDCHELIYPVLLGVERYDADAHDSIIIAEFIHYYDEADYEALRDQKWTKNPRRLKKLAVPALV